ncbi:DUF1573 domain-containing protein [Segetibacter sp. 3557_3]|uniref:DUF1573 domain-containing protein n=1 Tax=Segetibacter sp. 3557_3 TaxID=2547429 RepID=UPI001058839C|nr:DUF1573 domain-containing protein [Segetibacter sp. 3557_3]TDH27891.1 DUF1573 domain-containing protein [Segetibacter sp. 3557_3]
MKQVTLLVALMFSVGTLLAQSPIEFKETKYSFGKIKQNVPATHSFTFKNTSGKVVVIESAVAGCGCTTPDYPKNAIAPGASEQIKVTYNAAAMGTFTKDVTVKLAKVTEPIVLKIDGEVVAPEAAVSNGAKSNGLTDEAKSKASGPQLKPLKKKS